MSPKKQLTVKRPPRRGGTLMSMRSGFRKMTGHKDKRSRTAHKGPAGRITPGVRRGIVIALGAVIVIALVWGLAQR